jgi:hypothetical protein
MHRLNSGAIQARAGVYWTRQDWGVGTRTGGAVWQEVAANPMTKEITIRIQMAEQWLFKSFRSKPRIASLFSWEMSILVISHTSLPG